MKNSPLVNCFYRLANPSTTAMRWEAVAINADFWSQVLQVAEPQAARFRARRGHSVAPQGAGRNRRLQVAWPIASPTITNWAIASPEKGHRIALCPVVVECWDAPMNWPEVWKHQLRWARTIRVCQPLPYFFSILSNATLWPLLWLVVSLISPATPGPPLAAIACLLIRICLAQNLQRRFTPGRHLISPFWLVPVKDLLQVAFWLGAFIGNTVEWRGQRMKLRGTEL